MSLSSYSNSTAVDDNSGNDNNNGYGECDDDANGGERECNGLATVTGSALTSATGSGSSASSGGGGVKVGGGGSGSSGGSGLYGAVVNFSNSIVGAGCIGLGSAFAKL